MLTEPNRLFCEAYLANGFKAVDAYFTAYPDRKKNGDPKHPSYAYTLLRKPDVQEYLEKRKHEIYESYDISAERIAMELADIGFAEKGDEIYNTSFKLKALELLQKQFGLQNQKIETRNEIIDISLED